MFNKILVCLDGSSLAEQILPYAAEEAIRFGSQVVLLQVVITASRARVASLPGMAPVPAPVEQIRREESEAAAYLEQVAYPLRERGLDVQCVTLQAARLGKAIVSYANRNDVDLVAIATHGQGGLRRLVFGSVANFVLTNSGLPILLIRPKGRLA
jgi:nucleotide-binding universal stress UspA family protein